MDGEGAESILDFLRDYFAPDASDHVHRQVAEFLQYKRAEQTLEGYSLELDVLRCKAEERVRMGAALPDPFVPAICMQNASPS